MECRRHDESPVADATGERGMEGEARPLAVHRRRRVRRGRRRPSVRGKRSEGFARTPDRTERRRAGDRASVSVSVVFAPRKPKTNRVGNTEAEMPI